MAEEEFMTPLENYLKAGIHIGTKFKTKYMEPFIYKVRQDGLTVLNVQEIDKRIRVVAKMISRYEPEQILIVCRRENGWGVVKMFSELTGIRAFAGRYPPGILTNHALESFTETKLIMVIDPWPDRNVINDAINIGIPVIALCDTNNASNNIDLVLPCNNKGKKSLGLIFWILAREYLKSRNKEISKPLDDFIVE